MRTAALAGAFAIALAASAPAMETGIKGLSAEQIADLRAGKGMGLALSAELNGYPGPKHVLDLAGELGLTAEQRQRTAALHAAVKAESMKIGESIVDHEAAIDRLFASRAASLETLKPALAAWGERQGELRLTHLKYHLAMMEVLTPAQVARYNQLRGNAGAAPPAHKH
jgi:Spy/CpxP family protein refolding chaperone